MDEKPSYEALERRLAKLQKFIRRQELMLQRAQKLEAIGTLAGGIAHEFNNELGIILGNAELAIDDVAAGHPAHSFLREIRKAALRGKDMTRQLMRFSREPGARPDRINIVPIIKEALKLMRASISARIDIQMNVDNDCLTVIGEPTQIHQIVINLCKNAADAMKHGGTLGVHLEAVDLVTGVNGPVPELASGPYVRLVVTDSGVGIPPEHLHQIFDPFFTTKDADRGTGMGLSIVRGIVKRHGGAIQVESTPGEGSVFSVYLPAVTAAETAVCDAPGPLIGGTERILFLDDEASHTRIQKERLDRLGYHVEPYVHPEVALKAFKADPQRFDLVMTDMAMPKMSGDQFIARIREIRPDIPTIVSTGFSDQMDAEKAAAHGIDAFLLKPLSREELAGAVRAVLDAAKEEKSH